MVWEAARSYARCGIYVNPVYVTRGADGKKTVKPVGLWRKTASKSLADIGAWEQEHPDAGLLIATGESGLVVIDPDGAEGIAAWLALGPPMTARVRTPGGGEHWYYREHPDHVVSNDSSGKVAPKVDVRGMGGFVIAPPSHDGTGSWEWIDGEPDWVNLPIVPDLVIERMKAKPAAPAMAAPGGDDDFYDAPGRHFTREQATAFLHKAAQKLHDTKSGFNGAINDFAMACAHFPWYPMDREKCAAAMMRNFGKAQGWDFPDAEDIQTINSAFTATEAGKSWVALEVKEGAKGAEPARADVPGGGNLNITSAADMTYWLQEALGTGGLSGFFLQAGRVVHTPRMNESGYVAPKILDDTNGPAQIQAVNAGELTARIQYAYRCYKTVEDKKTGEFKEVAALFPQEAARRAIDAPDEMGALRPLAGITHTPMVRADGSVLAVPGYDAESRYLFLPGPGVAVSAVPEQPSDAEVGKAVGLLDEMTAGFPWDSPDDRANFYGMLLTPILRLVTPPAYKMFGITAHQPGSGKTLLADIATTLHGGVLRSEVPEDEPEWRKQATSILAGTSAPVVHLDNVTGVLRSSVLAGLLTADKPVTDRELGTSRVVTTMNDRTWVLTGNNLSLGGDLVRRTVLIQIDPNMARPESREFAIADLKSWVRDHRNDLLWAMLVMIRRWVAAGRPLQDRRQSDSYTAWQKTLGGILGACGVPGSFDAQSGEKAAVGGDDDGLAEVLERAWAGFGDRAWSAVQLLSMQTADAGFADMVIESRDWLPAPVLDKLARSEAAGRKTMGRWLTNRRGRWVTGSDGRSFVLRSAGRDQHASLWRVEHSG